MHFLQSSHRNVADAADLRQDVYAAVIEAAQSELPNRAKPFVFAVARNLLINRVRREHVVPIEAVADLDELGIAIDEPGPDRT